MVSIYYKCVSRSSFLYISGSWCPYPILYLFLICSLTNFHSAMSTSQATDLHALQQRFDVLATERELYNLVQDYAGYHDLCFGKGAGPDDDAKWESLLTPDAVSDLHP